MIGLIILLVAGTYLALWIAVVLFSYRRALRKGYGRKKAFAVGGFFFVVMYLIPFWDLIPTMLVHKNYCDNQAGIVVHKTIEQWEKENFEVLNTLEPYEKRESVDSKVGHIWKSNDRFGSIVAVDQISNFPIRKSYFLIIDIITQEIIYEKIDFVRGYSQFNVGADGWWKFWLYKNSCFSYDEARELGRATEYFFEKLRME